MVGTHAQKPRVVSPCSGCSTHVSATPASLARHIILQRMGCYLASKHKPRQTLPLCGQPCRTRGRNKKVCISPRSQLRSTLKAGSKLARLKVGTGIALLNTENTLIHIACCRLGPATREDVLRVARLARLARPARLAAEEEGESRREEQTEGGEADQECEETRESSDDDVDSFVC